MEKIKILWIITNGIRRNGICVSQLDYYKRIDSKQFSVDVIGSRDNSDDMVLEYKNAGCNVISLPDRKKELMKYCKKILNVMKENKYDIVHVHGSSSILYLELMLAKRAGVKIRIAHSRNTQCDHPIVNILLKPLFNHYCNYRLACGYEAGKFLFGNKDFKVFHNGKDFSKYNFNAETRKKIREKYNLKNKIAFGHVGLFNNQKNHSFLIDVFEEYHKFNNNSVLFLMGEGNLKNEIENKVKQKGLENSVIFLGNVDNVQDIICGLDCMLFPSLFEGLPNVVIEWQALGTNALISNKITNECVVTDFTKRLPITEGVECWIDEMKKIKELSDIDRKKQCEMGQTRLKENGFEIETNTKKLEDTYKQLMK